MRKEIMTDVTEIQQKQKKKALTGNMWIYALGVMGINFAIGLVNSYQAEFFNKILHADLIAVAIIILVAKFVSIFRAKCGRGYFFRLFRFSYSRCFRLRDSDFPILRAVASECTFT